MRGQKGVVFFCAGGTGGHLFPALALAGVLKERGYRLVLLTDHRGIKYSAAFPTAEPIQVLRSATFRGGVVNNIKTFWALSCGLWQALRLIWRYKPILVIGFGGYPSFAPLLGAIFSRIPTLIHEQNRVMGRANKVLAPYVSAIARGFPPEREEYSKKTLVTGNPLRADVLQAAQRRYSPPKQGEKFSIVVFGGSQGAQVFAHLVPNALELLSPSLRARFILTHQIVKGCEILAERYRQLGVEAELTPFFNDLPRRMALAHYIIARAGASSVAEICAFGCPALLVPYPYALDHDQAKNAAFLQQTGGVDLVKESDLSAEKLADFLKKALNNPEDLLQKSLAIKALSCLNAHTVLADYAERVIKR